SQHHQLADPIIGDQPFAERVVQREERDAEKIKADAEASGSGAKHRRHAPSARGGRRPTRRSRVAGRSTLWIASSLRSSVSGEPPRAQALGAHSRGPVATG